MLRSRQERAILARHLVANIATATQSLPAVMDINAGVLFRAYEKAGLIFVGRKSL